MIWRKTSSQKIIFIREIFNFWKSNRKDFPYANATLNVQPENYKNKNILLFDSQRLDASWQTGILNIKCVSN